MEDHTKNNSLDTMFFSLLQSILFSFNASEFGICGGITMGKNLINQIK